MIYQLITKLLLKSTLAISILLAVALLLPLTFDNMVQARICMTPDSPLGNVAKNFLNIPIIKQKITENPSNKTFLKVIHEASKNMTSLLCKPGEVATIFNATAPPYYPASNTAQAQLKGNDSISFKTTLEPTDDTTYFDIPQKSNFIFGSASPLCPTNDCKQEFIMAAYNAFDPQSPLATGTLKIENKTISTAQTIKYNLIQFQGNFDVTGIEENKKTGNNVMALKGDFGFGNIAPSPFYEPEFKYNVSGSFDNATKVLTFKGQRSTS
jgi:hypothetical protein